MPRANPVTPLFALTNPTPGGCPEALSSPRIATDPTPTRSLAPRCAPPPFSSACLGTLRLLGLFLQYAHEAAPVRPFLTELAVRHACPRDGVGLLPVAAKQDARVAGTLDGLFAAIVASRTEPYREETPAQLAERWLAHGLSLEGLDLVAMIWWIARDVGVALRPIERKIARTTHPARMLGSVQRAAVFGPWDLSTRAVRSR